MPKKAEESADLPSLLSQAAKFPIGRLTGYQV
jgi:hypothetical protein